MANVLNRFKEVAERRRDEVAVTHHFGLGKKNTISFGDLDRHSDEMASYLRICGLRPGEFVGIYMRKSIEHVVTILGVLKGGGVAYSVNPRARLPQLTQMAQASKSSKVVVDNTGIVNLGAGLDAGSFNSRIVYYSIEGMSLVHERLFQKIRESSDIVEYVRPGENKGVEGISPAIISQDAAICLFTSGSTGVPKGVVISHQDLCSRVETECRSFEIDEEDSLLSLLPFSFDVGCNQLFAALVKGAGLVILNSWLPTDICSVIEQYGVTGISGVPAIWSGILECDDRRVIEILDTVRYLTISGGDLPLSKLKGLRENLRHAGIYKTYGQTETFRSTILRPHEYDTHMTSVGRAVEGTEVRVINKSGREAEPDEEGEIVHRGDGMMMGYIGDTVGTRNKIRKHPLHNEAKAFPQKVVYTGDLARMDEDGYLYLLGRRDRMIKSSGYRIYPNEIMDKIQGLEGVKEAIVFGIADEKVGSSVICEIEVEQGSALTEREIREHLSRTVPSYMVPSKIMFVDSFPRTSAGKIRLSEVEKKYNG